MKQQQNHRIVKGTVMFCAISYGQVQKFARLHVPTMLKSE